jgi:sec-independent protein translocase protein TatB
MFNIGSGEFLVILLVALIVLGPQRLPEAARQAGKVMGELRKISSGFQTELRTALQDAENDTQTSRRAPLEKTAPAADAAVDPEVAAAIAAATATAESAHAATAQSPVTGLEPVADDDDQAAAS